MSSSVTIKGGQGSDTISFAFTTTGTHTTAYANAFASNVNSLLGTDSIVGVAPTYGAQASAGLHAAAAAGDPPVYVLDSPTVEGATPNYNIASSGYVLDTISGAVDITLVGGDTVLAAAINAEASVIGAGGNNQIVFVDGNNTFNGTADTGGDTVVAGSGFDTILTSKEGSTTVNSGTGDASIILQDTTAGGLNDFVWLDDGHSTVYANGVGDAIIATVEGQTIVGGATEVGGYMGVLLSDVNGTSTSGDYVAANAEDTVAVYDYSSNNSIAGGTGVLYFIGGQGITADIAIGNGSAFMFGADGENVTLATTAGDTGLGYFIAGAGNETLSGGAATSTLYLFGGQDSTGTDSLVGGSAGDVLTAGLGSETLTGGAGANYFQIADSSSGGANVLLSDFGVGGSTDNTLILSGFTAEQEQTLYNGGTEGADGNSYIVTLDTTTVTFTGITSGAQLQGHVVTF